MKSIRLIVAAGVGLGATLGSLGAFPESSAAGAMARSETVDLTPKFKPGMSVTFVQHTKRTDMMAVGGAMPETKPADKPADGKAEPAKAEPTKTEPARGGEAPADPAKSDPAKSEPAKTEPAKTEPSKSEQGIQRSSQGMSSTTSIDQTAEYELRVISASDQGAELELELKAVKATATIPQGDFSWDSAAPRDDSEIINPIAQAFRPIIGAVLKLTLNADGNIIGVQGDPRVNPNARGPLAPNIQALVGPDLVRVRWNSVFWVKDGRKPAAVGESWANTDELNAAAVGKYAFVTTSTLSGVKDGIANIAITGRIELTGTEPGKNPAGTLKDQMLKGSAEWDTATGTARKFVLEQRQTLDINAMGIPVTRTSDFVVTTTRK